jgi:hypothetical protein
MNGNFPGRCDSELDLIASDGDNRNPDIVPDDDLLVDLTGQNKHFSLR